MGYYVPGYHFYNVVESEEGYLLIFLKIGYVKNARLVDRYFTTLEAWEELGGDKIAEQFDKELKQQLEGLDFVEELDVEKFWTGIDHTELKKVLKYLNSPVYFEYVHAE